ncbi:uncharacterized protein J4E84_000420 [Alternaria hordeiaustralica]|uniref:uncharacterized protein n=1 Tax=Alternaria hordeiaustralica TaxID=1187925 RepID=UPI0020C438D6|nr:uncharacterized protein J4E84_000420 [Alternaria hordeiaustralica]KAI4697293.1 hypothetical protein J4E84_000420 [Alternaria hordeiaustralica]
MPPKASKKSSSAPANLPRTTNTHDIRRVLAERENEDGKREYLIDWAPTWEPMVSPKGIAATVLKEWRDTKKAKRTFGFKNNTVIKCANASADDSAEHILRMRKTVFDNFRETILLEPDGVAPSEFFKDEEWVFRSKEHRQRAEQIAKNLKENTPDAAEVIRHTYRVMRGKAGSSRYIVKAEDTDLPYRAIRVKYIGRIDAEIATDPGKRRSYPVVHFLTPLFDTSLRELRNPTWTLKNAHATALSLSETVAQFPTHAPYLLTHPLLLMFTRLFLLADEIAEKLDTVGIEVGEDWHERTRDEFLWTYCGDWEKRPVDCVERTYMATRDEVRWYVVNEADENGSAIVAASVDGSDGEASDGQDGEDEQAEDDVDEELED